MWDPSKDDYENVMDFPEGDLDNKLSRCEQETIRWRSRTDDLKSIISYSLHPSKLYSSGTSLAMQPMQPTYRLAAADFGVTQGEVLESSGRSFHKSPMKRLHMQGKLFLLHLAVKSSTFWIVENFMNNSKREETQKSKHALTTIC